REQMARRGISRKEVEAVLADYHTEYPDRQGNRIVIGHPAGRRVKVVVAKESDPPRIITAAD
ncbi:MAG: DUF4258 domain-containing protein, partial [Candidatus Dormiibacterota bacterium]